MPETITVNLSSYPENIEVNLTTESSGVTANLVETTLTFLEGAGLYRENVFTQDNTFQKDVYVGENLTVAGTTFIPHISGNTALSGNLTVTGNTSITGNLSVTGSASVDNVTFDLTPELAGGVGIMRWNDTDGTVDLGLKGGNVTLQLGQEFVARVVNKTGANLLESQYRVVRIRIASEGGAQGQRLAVVLAQGDSDPDSTTTLGVVTENIDNNQEGFITIMGQVRGINTTGSLQGETWVDGDVLYLSPIAAGQLTKFKPTAPQHSVTVAYVEYAHQNQGKLFVKVDNGYELNELHNVRITDVQEADVLTYDSTLSVWKNAPSGGGDYLPLAGGTVTGALVVQDGFTSNGDEVLFTGINFEVNNTNTVIESINSLSVTTPTVTFNATSGVSINGSLTASGIVTSPDYTVTGVSGAELSISKSVTTWEFGTKTLSVATQAAAPAGVDFNDTGSKAFVVNATGGALNVFQYNLTTPWDLATGSYSTIFKSVSGYDSAPRAVKFSRDGLYMFIVGFTGRSVARYTLTAPWDLSTISVNPTETLSLVPLVAALLGPQGVDFSLDGRKMYIANGFNTNTVYQFNLVNPWILTGATYSGNSLSVNVAPFAESLLQKAVISSDGTRMIILGLTQDRVLEYTLPTPYSLAGAFYHGAMRVSTVGNNTVNMPPVAAFGEANPTGLYYNDVLNKCFFIGDNVDRIQEIIVNPQILLIGERPLIRATGSTLGVGAGSVRMNSLRITDTTGATSNSGGGDGALTVQGGIGAANITVAGAIIGGNLRIDSTGTLVFNTRSTIASPIAGIFTFGTAPSLTDCNMLQIGPQGVSYPAIKRNGTGIDIVRSDQTTPNSTPLSGFTDLRANNITAFGKLSSTGPVIFPSSTVANLTGFPPASNVGGMLYVSNESGGATMAFSNGTNWLRVQDRAIVT